MNKFSFLALQQRTHWLIDILCWHTFTFQEPLQAIRNLRMGLGILFWWFSLVDLTFKKPWAHGFSLESLIKQIQDKHEFWLQLFVLKNVQPAKKIFSQITKEILGEIFGGAVWPKPWNLYQSLSQAKICDFPYPIFRHQYPISDLKLVHGYDIWPQLTRNVYHLGKHLRWV